MRVRPKGNFNTKEEQNGIFISYYLLNYVVANILNLYCSTTGQSFNFSVSFATLSLYVILWGFGSYSGSCILIVSRYKVILSPLHVVFTPGNSNLEFSHILSLIYNGT